MEDWAEVLSPALGRPEAEIRGRGLGAYDFASDLPAVEIIFPDGSTAKFLYAFFVVDQKRGRVGVFTEHCGYWDLPAWSLKVRAGDQGFEGPDG